MVYVCGCQVVVIFIICVVGLLFLYMLFLLCLDPLMTRRPVAYTEQHNEQPEEVSMVSSTAEHFEIDLVYFHGKLVGAFLQASWGLSAGYQPRPQVVDRGTTARYGGQLRYI